MSRDATVVLPLGPEDHTFRLAWGEIEVLQEECGAGPYVVMDRLLSGHWRVGDISSVIRLGLIGGGSTPSEALKLVKTYVEARPPLENLPLAKVVLGAGVSGVPEEEVGKKSNAASRGGKKIRSRTAKSDLPRSTAQAQ